MLTHQWTHTLCSAHAYIEFRLGCTPQRSASGCFPGVQNALHFHIDRRSRIPNAGAEPLHEGLRVVDIFQLLDVGATFELFGFHLLEFSFLAHAHDVIVFRQQRNLVHDKGVGLVRVLERTLVFRDDLVCHLERLAVCFEVPHGQAVVAKDLRPLVKYKEIN